MFDLVTFIKTAGYLGIFVVIFIESGVFFGFFFPGDSLLFVAGFLASQGFMNIGVLIFGVVLMAVLGVSAGYAFGRKVGPMIFNREDSLFFHKDNLTHTQHFYEKYGKKAIILARFMPGIRTFAPILAGVGKMNYPVFLAYNIIGGLLWGAGLPLLGYYLGNSIPNIDKYLIPIVLLIIFLSVLPTAVHILREKSSREKIFSFAKKMLSRKPGKILVFNWKMNPEKLDEALVLAKESDAAGVVVAAPFIFLEEAAKILKSAELSAQDVSRENSEINKGAYTGEISALELKNLGVKYVIIGHSERRKLGDTDEIIAKKIKSAVDGGLIPILCVGETKEEKNSGRTEEIIGRQLKTALLTFNLKPLTFNLIVAYEPVWAIGTGDPETPENALKAIKFIKKMLLTFDFRLSTKVLYGGSVTSQNLADYIKYKEIDGVLVGGASLNKEEIKKMIKIDFYV